jgi:hypothetical protein
MDTDNKFIYMLVDLASGQNHAFTDLPSVAQYLRTSAYDIAVRLRQEQAHNGRLNPTCTLELRNNVVLYYNSSGVPTDEASMHEYARDIYCLDLVTRTIHRFDSIKQAIGVTSVEETSILGSLGSEQLRPVGKYYFSYYKDKLTELPLITAEEAEAIANFENADEPHILILGSDVGGIASYESPIIEIIMNEYNRSFEYMIPWKPGIISHPVFQVLKETTHQFKNMREQICFILEHTSGESRAEMLAVTEEIYENKAAADHWLQFFKEFGLPSKWMDMVTKMHEVMTDTTEGELS